MPHPTDSVVRLCALALIMPAAALFGCQSEMRHTLGAAFTDTGVVAIQTLAASARPKSVVVQGEMIEKCPVAGCWFVLKDRSGVVRVDTKGAGFVVSEVPVHAKLTVAGTVTAGTQPGIAASGVRY